MNDIVYFLKENLSNNGVELGYSLRSLKNLPHGRVFMVTPKLPEWINPDTVEHIDHLPVHDNKWGDLGEKWKWLGTNDVMTDEVTYMDDDYYIVKPIYKPGPRHYFYPLRTVIEYFIEKHGPNNNLVTAMVNCERLLKEKGIEEPLCPQQHWPWPVVRSNIPVHWEDGKGPYDWKILEFGHNNPDPQQWLWECKVTSKWQLEFTIERDQPYLSSLDGPSLVDSGLLDLLEYLFPEKSEFERD